MEKVLKIYLFFTITVAEYSPRRKGRADHEEGISAGHEVGVVSYGGQCFSLSLICGYKSHDPQCGLFGVHFAP